MSDNRLTPPPARRSNGVIQELYNQLLDSEVPARPGDAPLPPEELKAARSAVAEFLEERPMRSLVKLDKDFHLQPKMEPSFESMVMSAGSTPAGSLPLSDTLTLMQGLIHNLKQHPGPHDNQYVMLMHALVNHALEREEDDPRDAQKVTTALQRIAHASQETLKGASYESRYPKKIRSRAQFKDVEETSRQLTMLTEGMDTSATSHLTSWNVEMLKSTRTALIEHLCRMHIPEFSEDSLFKTLKAKLRICPISRQEDADSHITSYVITVPEHHLLQRNNGLRERLITTLVGNGAEVDNTPDRITVTPEANGILGMVMSALEKQVNRPVRYR